MVEPNISKTYGYYKKQISLFLHDLDVNDYALICGKCVFNNRNMYVSMTKTFYFFLLIKNENNIIIII